MMEPCANVLKAHNKPTFVTFDIEKKHICLRNQTYSIIIYSKWTASFFL